MASAGEGLDPLDHLLNWQQTQRLMHTKGYRWLSQFALFEPFCKVLGPVMHWVSRPTNSAVTFLCMLAAPLVALLLLPLFLVLLPALFFFAVIAVLAVAMQTDSD